MTSHQNTLQGLRVLNTRPLEQGLILAKAISEAGGFSIALPALAILPTPDNWIKEIPLTDPIDQAIFISANGVRYFCEAYAQHHRKLSPKTHIIAIGKASADALRLYNVAVHTIPETSDSEHLLQLPSLQTVNNQTILLIKGKNGRELIAETLSHRGAHIIPLEVYHRDLPQVIEHNITSLWREDAVDIILFTSEQAIHNTATLLGEGAMPWLCNKPCMVISERLANVASLLGIKTIVISRYDAILSSLEHYIKRTAL